MLRREPERLRSRRDSIAKQKPEVKRHSWMFREAFHAEASRIIRRSKTSAEVTLASNRQCSQAPADVPNHERKKRAGRTVAIVAGVRMRAAVRNRAEKPHIRT